MVMGLWLGSVTTWFGSRSAYAIDGLLMFIGDIWYVTSYLWIKACRKMTKYSTIQKLDRSFSTPSFAASLKLPPLQDGGANYKTWRVRSMLWFTAMHCEHVIKGKRTKPALSLSLSAKEESKFNVIDNLFKGALISILVDNIIDCTWTCLRTMRCGMHLRPSLELLMLAVSCISIRYIHNSLGPTIFMT